MWKYGFLFLMLLSSCTAEEPVPEPTIPEEKMAKILAEIHLAEGGFQNEVNLTKDSLANLYYNFIFTKHGITDKEFFKNHNIYFHSAERLEKLYERVVGEITLSKGGTAGNQIKNVQPPKNRTAPKK